MLKTLGRIAGAGISSALLFATNAAALAQTTCRVNGREVPCDELGAAAAGFGLAFVAVMGLVGLAGMIFWILMLVHAAQHPVENKAMWIILMVFTGIVGSLIYYFVVKRPMDKQAAPSAPAAPSVPTPPAPPAPPTAPPTPGI